MARTDERETLRLNQIRQEIITEKKLKLRDWIYMSHEQDRIECEKHLIETINKIDGLNKAYNKKSIIYWQN